ncbi:type II toxin-antitoxin system RelE family toxin [Endothiovibrio diazotrophicus]
MSYQVLITRRADKQLKKLPAVMREKVVEEIAMLGHDPSDPSLDIKPLTNDPDARFRLRIGAYRVKFNRDDEIHIIEVMRVGHRREIYR